MIATGILMRNHQKLLLQIPETNFVCWVGHKKVIRYFFNWINAIFSVHLDLCPITGSFYVNHRNNSFLCTGHHIRFRIFNTMNCVSLEKGYFLGFIIVFRIKVFCIEWGNKTFFIPYKQIFVIIRKFDMGDLTIMWVIVIDFMNIYYFLNLKLFSIAICHILYLSIFRLG